jgi:opacity protein-like surface antigen
MRTSTMPRMVLSGILLCAGANAADAPPGVELSGSLERSDGAAGTADTAPSESSSTSSAKSEGFEHGLRLGIGLPIGKTGEANDLRSGEMSGVVGFRVPVWLDLGYRLNPSWWVGLAPELGLGTAGTDCDEDQECEWSDLRLSAQAIYSLSPGSSADPWIGAGVGWESLRGSVTLTAINEQTRQEGSVRLREALAGPQVFVQGGMRFDMGEALTIGPYLSASAGMYLLDEYECPEGVCPTDSDVEEPQLHAWFGLGVRGTHGP